MGNIGRADRTEAASRAAHAARTPRHGARAQVLARTRNLKMARSAHAFVRGNTVKF